MGDPFASAADHVDSSLVLSSWTPSARLSEHEVENGGLIQWIQQDRLLSSLIWWC